MTIKASGIRHKAPYLSPDEQAYIVDGERYARITHVLAVEGDGLDVWRKKVGPEEAERISREAAEYGTLVHKLTALHDTKKWRAVERLVDKYSFLLAHHISWYDWAQTYVSRIPLVEKIVYSRRLRVAGTLDRVLVMKGDKGAAIADIKTGSLNDAIGRQLALYGICYNEMGLKPRIIRYLVVSMPRLSPGKLIVKDYTRDIMRYVNEAMALVKTYHEINGG